MHSGLIKRRDFLKRSLAGTALAATGLSFKTNSFADPVLPPIPTTPTPPSPNHYARMFPHLTTTPVPAQEEWLIKLGQNMKDSPDSRPDPKHPPPMAGYTYLGQFINHDLTFDLTPLDQVGPDPASMTNLRTPFLDLDHLYGGGPKVSPFLYDRSSKPGEEKFLIGQTAPSSVDGKDFPSTLDDLPRNAQGFALVIDPRQDENLIIAQLHVAFLKLHNRVIDRNTGLQPVRPAGLQPAESQSLFEQARQIVRWHYQWIVRHDFLRAILDPEVFSTIYDSRLPNNDLGIPIEYSLAAGRFGHSMVRDEYFVNDLHFEANLKDDISRLTGMRGGIGQRLPADWVISWERFFFTGSGINLVRHSRAIDTRIAQGLFEAEHPGSPPLPVKTLLRGHRAGLPSGQEIARACGLDPLAPDQIANGPDQEILVRAGFDRATPLWYYILKEAELTGHGAHLGALGSKLVANVIMSALSKDPGSYESLEPGWVPTLPGPENPELFGVADLLRFISAPIS